MDPILLGVSVKKRPIRYMAKEELFVKHGKAVNRFLRTLGAFPVKRGSGDTKAIEQQLKFWNKAVCSGFFLREALLLTAFRFSQNRELL